MVVILRDFIQREVIIMKTLQEPLFTFIPYQAKSRLLPLFDRPVIAVHIYTILVLLHQIQIVVCFFILLFANTQLYAYCKKSQFTKKNIPIAFTLPAFKLTFTDVA